MLFDILITNTRATQGIVLLAIFFQYVNSNAEQYTMIAYVEDTILMYMSLNNIFSTLSIGVPLPILFTTSQRLKKL